MIAFLKILCMNKKEYCIGKPLPDNNYWLLFSGRAAKLCELPFDASSFAEQRQDSNFYQQTRAIQRRFLKLGAIQTQFLNCPTHMSCQHPPERSKATYLRSVAINTKKKILRLKLQNSLQQTTSLHFLI